MLHTFFLGKKGNNLQSSNLVISLPLKTQVFCDFDFVVIFCTLFCSLFFQDKKRKKKGLGIFPRFKPYNRFVIQSPLKTKFCVILLAQKLFAKTLNSGLRNLVNKDIITMTSCNWHRVLGCSGEKFKRKKYASCVCGANGDEPSKFQIK